MSNLPLWEYSKEKAYKLSNAYDRIHSLSLNFKFMDLYSNSEFSEHLRNEFGLQARFQKNFYLNLSKVGKPSYFCGKVNRKNSIKFSKRFFQLLLALVTSVIKFLI